MSKNTRSTAFRKIDVDEYNEDNYKEDEAGEGQLSAKGPNEAEINQLLMSGRNADALRHCLQNAPLGSKSQDVKDQALSITLRVLASVKTLQMPEVVQSLTPEQVDVLMKYIYRGFEVPAEASNSNLLSWHENTFAKGGVGCIARVLSDRKRV